MDIIVNRLKLSHKGIRRALMGTFVVNLVCTSILLMFAFGFKDITNETLSKNDLEQIMAIISSIILVSIICICFLQWVIGIEIKALFKSRREFNINMRLMGVSSKNIGNIYKKELFHMQYIVIPIGVVLTLFFYGLIAANTSIPWIGFDIILIAIIIHLASIFISMSLVLRKLVVFEVAYLIRTQSENTAKGLGKLSKWFGVIGIIIIMVSLLLAIIFLLKDMEIFYIIGALLAGSWFFYALSKWTIKVADRYGISSISLSERIQIGNYKKNKNTIIMLSIGIMLFLGLQILFITTRYVTNNVGQNNINYQNHVVFNEPVLEGDLYQIDNSKQGATGLDFVFYIEQSSYPKHLYGIDKSYLNLENIKIDEKLSRVDIEKKLEDPNWNGILLPNAAIGADNIGKEMIVTIDGHKINFVIEGGYYQNTFDKSIWLGSKAYIQKQLGIEGYCNAIYLVENDDAVIEKLEQIGQMKLETKQTIIKNSVNKVVQSTELVEITSLIVIICAIVSITSYLILGANENIRNIAKFRSAGMEVHKARKIYVFQLCGVILRGFVMGIILAVLFAKVALNSVLARVNSQIELQIPYLIIVLLLIIINIVVLFTFYASTKKGFEKDFTMILRKNENL